MAAQIGMQWAPAVAIVLIEGSVAAHERSVRTGLPQRLGPGLELRKRRRLLPAIVLLLLLLLQDASPGLQQVLLRVAAHEQRCI